MTGIAGFRRYLCDAAAESFGWRRRVHVQIAPAGSQTLSPLSTSSSPRVWIRRMFADVAHGDVRALLRRYLPGTARRRTMGSGGW